MKFICPGCKSTLKRDMRKQENKHFLTKNGYKSYCDFKQKDCICRRLND